MESPLSRRDVPALSGSTVAEGALRTWGTVREDEKEPADPVDTFKSWARVGGNKVPTGKGFLPVYLLKTGDEVASLVDSSLP